MSHHGNGVILTPEQEKILDELKQKYNDNLGATGQFPEEKIRPDDRGEIKFSVGIDKGKVVLDFGGVPICWIGLTTEQARQIIIAIQNSIDKIEHSN